MLHFIGGIGIIIFAIAEIKNLIKILATNNNSPSQILNKWILHLASQCPVKFDQGNKKKNVNSVMHYAIMYTQNFAI